MDSGTVDLVKSLVELIFSAFTNYSIETYPNLSLVNEKKLLYSAIKEFIKNYIDDKATITIVGSSAYDIKCFNGDLDLAVYTNISVSLMLNSLLLILCNITSKKSHNYKYLFKHSQFQFIYSSKVPLLKIYQPSGLICDISVNPYNSLYHSLYFKNLLEVFPDKKEFYSIIKYWTRARNLPTTRHGGIPSIAWLLITDVFSNCPLVITESLLRRLNIKLPSNCLIDTMALLPLANKLLSFFLIASNEMFASCSIYPSLNVCIQKSAQHCEAQCRNSDPSGVWEDFISVEDPSDIVFIKNQTFNWLLRESSLSVLSSNCDNNNSSSNNNFNDGSRNNNNITHHIYDDFNAIYDTLKSTQSKSSSRVFITKDRHCFTADYGHDNFNDDVTIVTKSKSCDTSSYLNNHSTIKSRSSTSNNVSSLVDTQSLLATSFDPQSALDCEKYVIGTNEFTCETPVCNSVEVTGVTKFEDTQLSLSPLDSSSVNNGHSDMVNTIGNLDYMNSNNNGNISNLDASTGVTNTDQEKFVTSNEQIDSSIVQPALVSASLKVNSHHSTNGLTATIDDNDNLKNSTKRNTLTLNVNNRPDNNILPGNIKSSDTPTSVRAESRYVPKNSSLSHKPFDHTPHNNRVLSCGDHSSSENNNACLKVTDRGCFDLLTSVASPTSTPSLKSRVRNCNYYSNISYNNNINSHSSSHNCYRGDITNPCNNNINNNNTNNNGNIQSPHRLIHPNAKTKTCDDRQIINEIISYGFSPHASELSMKITAATWLVYKTEAHRSLFFLTKFFESLDDVQSHDSSYWTSILCDPSSNHQDKLNSDSMKNYTLGHYFSIIIGELCRYEPFDRYTLPGCMKSLIDVTDQESQVLCLPTDSRLITNAKWGLQANNSFYFDLLYHLNQNDYTVSISTNFALVLLYSRPHLVEITGICSDYQKWWAKSFLSRRDSRSIIHAKLYSLVSSSEIADLLKQHNVSFTPIENIVYDKLPFNYSTSAVLAAVAVPQLDKDGNHIEIAFTPANFICRIRLFNVHEIQCNQSSISARASSAVTSNISRYARAFDKLYLLDQNDALIINDIMSYIKSSCWFTSKKSSSSSNSSISNNDTTYNCVSNNQSFCVNATVDEMNIVFQAAPSYCQHCKTDLTSLTKHLVSYNCFDSIFQSVDKYLLSSLKQKITSVYQPLSDQLVFDKFLVYRKRRWNFAKRDNLLKQNSSVQKIDKQFAEVLKARLNASKLKLNKLD